MTPAETDDTKPAEAVVDAPRAETSAGLGVRGALSLIGFYQRFVSPGLPPSCRFYPSCSRYTYGAIERFGLARGLYLGAFRVCRCHPWNAGGIDEVPAQFPPFRAVKQRTVAKIKALFTRVSCQLLKVRSGPQALEDAPDDTASRP